MTRYAAQLMTRTSLTLGLALVVTTSGCGTVNEAASAWSPDGTGAGLESGGSSVGPESSVGDVGTTTDVGEDDTADATTGDGGTDAGATEDTAGIPIDCTPAWAEPWIGSPCATDIDCSYDGGFCLRDDEG